MKLLYSIYPTIYIEIKIYYCRYLLTIEFNYLMYVYMFMPLYGNSLSAGPWREIQDICKSKGSYPIGNLNLSNVKSACDKLYNIAPRWVGVVKDQYIGQDQGKLSLPNIFLLKYQRAPRNRFSKIRALCTN